MIIGVTGHMGAGKNEVGRILEEKAGYHPVALADTLREMAIALDPWVDDLNHDRSSTFQHAFGRLSSIVNHWGWEEAKTLPEVRRLLQRLGTEAGRDILGPRVWIDALEHRIHGLAYHGIRDIVVTDVRFVNEADWIHKLNGGVWKVIRPHYDGDGHASERGVDEIVEDVTIWNRGTLQDLEAEVLANLEVVA